MYLIEAENSTLNITIAIMDHRINSLDRNTVLVSPFEMTKRYLKQI